MRDERKAIQRDWLDKDFVTPAFRVNPRTEDVVERFDWTILGVLALGIVIGGLFGYAAAVQDRGGTEETHSIASELPDGDEGREGVRAGVPEAWGSRAQ